MDHLRNQPAASSSKPASKRARTKKSSATVATDDDDEPLEEAKAAGASIVEEAAELGATAVDAVAGIVTDAAEEVAHAVESVAEDVGAVPGKSSGVAAHEGEKLPTGIKLRNERDEEVDLDSIFKAAKKATVIFCYPKASTPGCTNQACAFRDSTTEFEALDAQVYGLSHDTPNAQLKWQTAKSLGYSLLCDPKQLLLKPLGASKGAGKLARSHFVVGTDGTVLHAKIGVKPADSAKDALEFVKSL